jgi:dUTP pyrophosphatase
MDQITIIAILIIVMLVTIISTFVLQNNRKLLLSKLEKKLKETTEKVFNLSIDYATIKDTIIRDKNETSKKFQEESTISKLLDSKINSLTKSYNDLSIKQGRLNKDINYYITKLKKEENPIIEYVGELDMQTDGSAAYDLFAQNEVKIGRGRQVLVNTGVRINLPYGYEAQVRPRSGLANRYKLSITNSPGTIDSDYRGEIKVLLINHGSNTIELDKFSRIAQLVINKLPNVKLKQISESEFNTDDTSRGEGGFGSTGV